jgi:hypothetical protein
MLVAVVAPDLLLHKHQVEMVVEVQVMRFQATMVLQAHPIQVAAAVAVGCIHLPKEEMAVLELSFSNTQNQVQLLMLMFGFLEARHLGQHQQTQL